MLEPLFRNLTNLKNFQDCLHRGNINIFFREVYLTAEGNNAVGTSPIMFTDNTARFVIYDVDNTR